MEKGIDFGIFLKQFFTLNEIKNFKPIVYLATKTIIYRFLCKIFEENIEKGSNDNIIPLINSFVQNKLINTSLIQNLDKKLNKLINDSYFIPISILEELDVPDNYNIDNFENDTNLWDNVQRFLTALNVNDDLISISSLIKRLLLSQIYEKYILTDEKSKGAYYTPSIIAKYICSDLFINENKEEFSNISYGKKTKNHDMTKIAGKSNYKILDPACGTGIFLVESLSLILSKYSNSKLKFEVRNNQTEIIQLLDALSCVYGSDIDPIAIAITKINLLFTILTEKLDILKKRDSKVLIHSIFKKLNQNILSHDFLTNDIYNKPIFDIILGNPPYINSKEMEPDYKQILKKKYRMAIKQFDIYTIFLEKSYQILKSGGSLGFIIPDSFLGRSHFELIRKLLLENTSIRKIDQIKGIFINPNVSNIILFFKKSVDDNIIQFNRYQDLISFSKNKGECIKIPQKYFLDIGQSKILFLDHSRRILISRLLKINQKLGDFIVIHRGEEIGKKSLVIRGVKTPDSVKILFGENIGRYSINFRENYIDNEDILKKKNVSLYNSPKILIRQLGIEINAAFDADGEFATLQTVYNLQLTTQKIENEYLLGILNSKLMNFFYTTVFQEKMLFPRILLENIKGIPVIIPIKNVQKKIANLVRKISAKKKIKENTTSLEEIVDDLVFEIYKISNSEKKLILGV